MGSNRLDKIEKTIQIDIRKDVKEDDIFSELYDLISHGKKKEAIQKSLIFFLKKGNEELLEMLFGDKLDEAKALAKKRVPRAKKPATKRTIKKETVENKAPVQDVVSDGKEEIKDVTEEVVEEVLPTESAQEEEIVVPEVVIETPETEVIKDDLSSDEEIMNILKSQDTGSSTTEEKKGKNKDFMYIEGKDEDSSEQSKSKKDRFLMEMEERKRISEERRIASDKEMGEFFENLRRERKE